MNGNLDPIGLELPDYVYGARVAQVGAVFLEAQAEHVHFGILDWAAVMDQAFNRLLRNELAHTVVDLAPGKNDLWMIA